MDEIHCLADSSHVGKVTELLAIDDMRGQPPVRMVRIVGLEPGGNCTTCLSAVRAAGYQRIWDDAQGGFLAVSGAY